MAKKNNSFICQECGTLHAKWVGKCEACSEWNTIVEEKISSSTPVFGKSLNDNKILKSNDLEIIDLNSEVLEVERSNTGLSELDRVLGGGLVRGSAILLGGDPGIGKSTLLLQSVISLCSNGHECLYVSGEESTEQIKLRSKRLQKNTENVKVAAATLLSEILKYVNKSRSLQVLIIDSIQTIFNDALDSAPGTVSQIRACAFELIRVTKQRNISLILVGHVTKEGSIAGPKVLEHMVDTVLYFEGERGNQFRIIRTVKNRFGAANEIGVFEMNEQGLSEISNPSMLFLASKGTDIAGSTIYSGIEGSRPLLLEIQALVAPSYLASPRRSVIGWDNNRLAMLIAVLNSRYGLNLLDKEVYLNVVGGLKISEPAADLAVVATLISAFKNIIIPSDTVFFGEVGLSGEVRTVINYELRVNEAQKLGFKKVIAPYNKKILANQFGIDIITIKHIQELDNILN